MQVERKKIVELFETILSIEQEKNRINPKFLYALIKNKKSIKSSIEEIAGFLKPIEDYDKFENDRIELCKTSAEKDKNGKPKIENNNFYITDKEKFSKDMKILEERHKDAVEKKKKQDKDFKKFLEKKINVNLHIVDIDNFLDMDMERIEKLLVILSEQDKSKGDCFGCANAKPIENNDGKIFDMFAKKNKPVKIEE